MIDTQMRAGAHGGQSPDSSDVLVEVRKLTQSFGSTNVLKGIDLAIKNGEFLTILGPSGSGKTSVLRILAGFAKPSGGDVVFSGNSILSLPASKRPFNTVFQDYALFPHLTVRDNVAFGLRVRGVGKQEREAATRDALALVSLEKLSNRYPHELSGGQRQRVALARALICKPRIILLDEPLSALDANLRRQMQQFLKSVQREVKTTFVFVTHDQEEAMDISDRICVINNGLIEQIDSPDRIYKHPQTEFVARFFGESNFLPMKRDGAGYSSALGHIKTVHPEIASGEALLSIRPEEIRFLSDGQIADNSFEAFVQEADFAGATVKFLLSHNGLTLIARTLSTAPDLPAPGQTVRIGWNAQAGSLLARTIA